ncbi:MAG: hypothetical protein JW918_12655 [Anaerolineae bacterium]|nr:hypothetical protein [Anaerolineae bacterium]
MGASRLMRAAPDLRLPGVYFLPPVRPAGLDLPPLDVAAFVGFAERGPLHLPVPVDDLSMYRAVFGGELPLARGPGGQLVYANLPRAVAGFFANGGRRCYVVRVAGEGATAARLRVPGVVALSGSSSASLAALFASSVGGWAARLRLGVRLRSTPLPPEAFQVQGARRLAWQTGSAPDAILPGDLLRLTFVDGAQWLFPVVSVERSSGDAAVSAERAWRLNTAVSASPPPVIDQVSLLTLDGMESLDVFGVVLSGVGAMHLELTGGDASGIQRGDVLHLALNDGTACLFPVDEQRSLSEITLPPGLTSPPMQRVSVGAKVALQLPAADLPAANLWRVERLRFDLLVQEGDRQRLTVSEVAFNAGHPRFWGEVALLESSPLYHRPPADGARRPARSETTTSVRDTQAAQAARQFWAAQGDARIEAVESGRLDVAGLAGLLAPVDPDAADRLVYLPLDMLAVVTGDDFVGPAESYSGDDGLEAFAPTLFVDRYLVPSPANPAAGESARTLKQAAFDRYYIQNRRLRGMHSLMFVDEVALLSVSDSVHRRWELADVKPSVEPAPQPPAPTPQPTFTTCDQATEGFAAGEGGTLSPAEETVQLDLPVLRPLASFSNDALLAIQHAVLDLCQARSDVVGILTLPLHSEKRQCIAWQEALRKRLGLPDWGKTIDEAQDVADLSYVAVYHPWLWLADEDSADGLRAVPCDGAVCGMIAARERARQVWVAPANVPLQDVLGLTPAFPTDDWAELFDRQFNLIRSEPVDFRAMSAHTLSDERSLLQISVRRLMILLCKVALDRGMDFVFASNHEHFREGVRVMLENLLRFMFERGAFAGATPNQAFRVVTDASVSTLQDVDQGRFIAKIQVAPSQPMEFITVLLTRVSEGLLLATEI